jgi:hypothetical protein
MRSITLELPTRALEPLGLLPRGFFDRYEELELVETLGLEPQWRLQVLRLRSRAPPGPSTPGPSRTREIRRAYGLERFELLESRPSTRDRFFLVRQRNPGTIAALLSEAHGEVYPGRPFLLREQVTLASLRGEPTAVDRVLRRLRSLGVPFQLKRVLPGMGNPSAAVPLLTPRQAKVLEEALRRGFYEQPRRVSLTRLAKALGISPVALGRLLRRAEGSLARRFLETGAGAGRAGPGG